MNVKYTKTKDAIEWAGNGSGRIPACYDVFSDGELTHKVTGQERGMYSCAKISNGVRRTFYRLGEVKYAISRGDFE